MAAFPSSGSRNRESRDSQFERIVGNSAGLETVLKQVERVAAQHILQF